MEDTAVALLIFRVAIGGTLMIHGLDHWRGGNGTGGIANWFERRGLRPGHMHAGITIVVEIVAGIAVAIGLFTPVTCGALLGVATVAGIVEHRRNGFFVFRNGYEYMLMIGVLCLGLSISGPGEISADVEFGLALPTGPMGSLIALLVGVGGAILLLASGWDPSPPVPAEEKPVDARPMAD